MKHTKDVTNKNRRLRARLGKAERDFNTAFRMGAAYMKRAVVAEVETKRLRSECQRLRSELACALGAAPPIPHYSPGFVELIPSEHAPAAGVMINPYDAGHSPAEPGDAP